METLSRYLAVEPSYRCSLSGLNENLAQWCKRRRKQLIANIHLSCVVSSEFHTSDAKFEKSTTSGLALTTRVHWGSHTHRALPDVQTSPQLVAPLLQCTNTFVLIQNGLGIERDFQTAVPDATVISGCAWIDCTTIDSGRKVLHDSFVRV